MFTIVYVSPKSVLKIVGSSAQGLLHTEELHASYPDQQQSVSQSLGLRAAVARRTGCE